MIEPVVVISRPGSELKAVEEACGEASQTADPLNGLNVLNGVRYGIAMERLERASVLAASESLLFRNILWS